MARNGAWEDIWAKEPDEGPETEELGRGVGAVSWVEKALGGQVRERRNAADHLSVI